jgi:hypothetical protein
VQKLFLSLLGLVGGVFNDPCALLFVFTEQFLRLLASVIGSVNLLLDVPLSGV